MKKYWPLVLIFVFSLIPLIDLFHPGLPLTHDGQDHVARIANFYKNLTEGNIIPRWAGNLNWGYGHPILMFLYPLPSYLASLFHFFGFNFVNSVKIVFGLAFIASGFAMYIWVKEFLDKYSAFLASILYMYAPYRFIDLYVRGAIGEHVAFVFPPLIMYFLLKISQKQKSRWSEYYFLFLGATLSMAGLILSHNAITIMFIPFLGIYFLFLLKFNKEKRRFFLLGSASILLGFLLSSFFLIPAFFEGKYTLRDIVTGKDYLNHFVNPVRFFNGPWRYGGSGEFSVQIGIVQIFAVLLSITLIFRKGVKAITKVIFIMTIIFFLGSLFLMIPQSLFIYKTITTLQKFQFPWRFLTVTVFTTSVLSGLAIFLINNQKVKKIVLITFIVMGALFYNGFWHAKGFNYKSEKFYTSIYNGTTDTGESAPIWSIRFMEKKPVAKMQVISGQGTVQEGFRTSTYHTYKIQNSETSRIVENTLYFPGWEILVDKKSVPLQFQDPQYRGLMTFTIPSGIHTVEVIFKETKLRVISDILSVVVGIGLLLIGIIIILQRALKKNI